MSATATDRTAIADAIADRRCPGAVLWLERSGAVYAKAYGQRALVPAPEPMTEGTIFDLASLTKVVVTTTLSMILVDEGKLDLDARARRLWACQLSSLS